MEEQPTEAAQARLQVGLRVELPEQQTAPARQLAVRREIRGEVPLVGQSAEPQLAEPQLAEPQLAEPQLAEPQLAEVLRVFAQLVVEPLAQLELGVSLTPRMPKEPHSA